MAKDDATSAVKEKIGEVTSEQGTLEDVSSEAPENFGHSSAQSAGVGGKSLPGGKSFLGPTGKD